MDSHLAERSAEVRPSSQGSLRVCEAKGRRLREIFVRFPWRIYKSDPQWVPPLLVERRDFINPQKHPFYLHGAAVPLLAFRGSEPVGRLLVSDDTNYNREHQSNVGCFGMFESVDDDEVARALVNAGADWLRARGRDRIRGPIDYSLNYACGLLVDGFDTPPRIMMTHNPPHYERLLLACGLAKAKDLYAWWFDDSNDMLAVWGHRAKRLAARGKIQVRPLCFDDLDAEIERCKGVYNAAWERTWGFVKMTDAEFHHLAKQLKVIAMPDLLLLAEVDGEPVGFSMTLPDLNEVIRPLNGRLFRWGLPLGLIRLYWNRRCARTARLMALGILQPFRRRGVAELLILRTLDYGKHQVRFTGAELSWTLEDNDLINRTIEAVGGRRYKTYRIYERAI
ncbi:MAG TPA: GNAT family N-acetyltransferase [Pirellulales bacterium]|nr:GNAT family N-acetyltransferase [Pirellulales bacterium]